MTQQFNINIENYSGLVLKWTKKDIVYVVLAYYSNSVGHEIIVLDSRCKFVRWDPRGCENDSLL